LFPTPLKLVTILQPLQTKLTPFKITKKIISFDEDAFREETSAIDKLVWRKSSTTSDISIQNELIIINQYKFNASSLYE
jgi:hypothetical protein